MADLPGYDIRYTYVSDISYLRDWLHYPDILHWFPLSEEKEIEDAVQCWIGFSRYSSSLTATMNGVPCAIGTLFLMPYQKVAHHCLFKMIVDPKFQRQGIGSSLLKNLKHLAKQYFKLELMHIEIFEGNPIIHLLKKADFHEYARQERYVKEDGKYLARILFEGQL
ncbi:MAG TPA: GNAT family N-acetyltransferase [Rhabdochlamydiaceae bacterium]|nr:GNAT family N-acetyltransferase [Rhabdochlamydiaceae bacterium]